MLGLKVELGLKVRKRGVKAEEWESKELCRWEQLRRTGNGLAWGAEGGKGGKKAEMVKCI